MPDPGVYVTARVYDSLAEALPFSAAGTITVDGSRESVWRLTESP
jgi:hypothetical protein